MTDIMNNTLLESEKSSKENKKFLKSVILKTTLIGSFITVMLWGYLHAFIYMTNLNNEGLSQGEYYVNAFSNFFAVIAFFAIFLFLILYARNRFNGYSDDDFLFPLYASLNTTNVLITVAMWTSMSSGGLIAIYTVATALFYFISSLYVFNDKIMDKVKKVFGKL